MELSLIEQLTLLALDDEKGTFIPDSTSYAYALAGAVVLELALEDRIMIRDGRVHAVEKTRSSGTYLDEYLLKIRSSAKNRSIRYWIEKFGDLGQQLKQDTLQRLLDSQILERKRGKILYVFHYTKYPVHNPIPENQLRKRLNEIIVGLHKPDLKEYMLLSLVQSCHLEKEVFGKDRKKVFRSRMKSLSESNQLATAVSKSVQEVIETVNAILVVMIATMVATTSSAS